MPRMCVAWKRGTRCRETEVKHGRRAKRCNLSDPQRWFDCFRDRVHRRLRQRGPPMGMAELTRLATAWAEAFADRFPDLARVPDSLDDGSGCHERGSSCAWRRGPVRRPCGATNAVGQVACLCARLLQAVDPRTMWRALCAVAFRATGGESVRVRGREYVRARSAVEWQDWLYDLFRRIDEHVDNTDERNDKAAVWAVLDTWKVLDWLGPARPPIRDMRVHTMPAVPGLRRPAYPHKFWTEWLASPGLRGDRIDDAVHAAHLRKRGWTWHRVARFLRLVLWERQTLQAWMRLEPLDYPLGRERDWESELFLENLGNEAALEHMRMLNRTYACAERLYAQW